MQRAMSPGGAMASRWSHHPGGCTPFSPTTSTVTRRAGSMIQSFDQQLVSRVSRWTLCL